MAAWKGLIMTVECALALGVRGGGHHNPTDTQHKPALLGHKPWPYKCMKVILRIQAQIFSVKIDLKINSYLGVPLSSAVHSTSLGPSSLVDLHKELEHLSYCQGRACSYSLDALAVVLTLKMPAFCVSNLHLTVYRQICK